MSEMEAFYEMLQRKAAAKRETMGWPRCAKCQERVIEVDESRRCAKCPKRKYNEPLLYPCGHKRIPGNTYTWRGSARCSTCQRINQRAYRDRKAAHGRA